MSKCVLKRYILFLSIVFTVILLFLITSETSGKEHETGKKTWEPRIKLEDNYYEKKADCIIIGTVTEVKDTPDDDFYFHQAIISVERWIKGDKTQKRKEIILNLKEVKDVQSYSYLYSLICHIPVIGDRKPFYSLVEG